MRNEIEGGRGQPRENLGIYRPANLQEALLRLGDTYLSKNWPPREYPNSSRRDEEIIETMGYFVGLETACKLWQDSPTRSNPAIPFRGIEKLLQPTNEPQNVLLVGCAGSESYRIEQKMIKEARIKIKTHTTIDISAYPLNRITQAISQDAELKGTDHRLVQADAAEMQFPDGSFNMVFSDLMLGSVSRVKESKMLNEIARVTKAGGIFVMRASNFSDEQIAQITPAMNVIGYSLHSWATKKYGEDQLTHRDKHYGFTKEQWVGLGRLYSNFTLKQYFGNNRFKTPEEVYSFLEEGNKFKVERTEEEKLILLDDFRPVKYLAVRARRLDNS